MSVLGECEGCSKLVRQDILVRKGLFNLPYCPMCLIAVKKFIDDRDALHDKVQDTWKKGIRKLQKKCRDKNIKRLPDEYQA